MSWIASRSLSSGRQSRTRGLAMTKYLFLSLMLLCGCREQRPPAPTSEQNQQLNEAEDMLNGMARNEEGPADRSASPSNQSE